MKLIPVDDSGESTGSAVASDDYRLVPVDDSGSEIKSIPVKPRNLFVDSARSTARMMLGNGMSEFIPGLASPIVNRGIEAAKGVADDVTRDFSDKPFLDLPIARIATPKSVGNLAISSALDPRALTGIVAGGLEGISSSMEARAADNPTLLNTFLKGPKYFDNEIASAESSKVVEAAKASNFIKQNSGAIYSGNSTKYGEALDKIPSTLTRDNLIDSMTATLEHTHDPNITSKPAYQRLMALAEEHSPNTSDFESGVAKKDAIRDLQSKIARGEYADQSDFDKYKLTPAEEAAVKSPKHVEDIIKADQLQQIRRQVRSVAGRDPVARFAADHFDFAIGNHMEEGTPGLQALNKRYGPVLSAKMKALKLFNPFDKFGTAGEDYLRNLGTEATNGTLSPTDAQFIDTLGYGNKEFAGVGPSLEDSMTSMKSSSQRIAKMKALKESNRNMKVLLTATGSGYGLFKSHLLNRLLGL